MKYFGALVALFLAVLAVQAENSNPFKIAEKPAITLSYSDNLTRAIAFNPESSEVAVADARGIVDIISTHNGQRRLRIQAYPKKVIFAVAYSKNGQLLATGVWGKAPVKIFNVQTGKLVRELKGEENAISLDFSSDNKYLASATEDGTVKLFYVKTGKLKALLHKKKVSLYYPSEIRFSPDGKQLACAIANKKKGTLIWNVASGKLVKRIPAQEDMLHLQYSNDGSMLAVGGGKGRKKKNYVYLYDAKNYKLKKVFKEHGDYIYGVGFSPDSKYLITTAWEVGIRLRVWEIASGKRIQLIKDKSGQSEALAVSPNGKYAAFRLRTLGNLGNPYTFKLYKTSLAVDISSTADPVSDNKLDLPGTKGLVLMRATNGFWYPAKLIKRKGNQFTIQILLSGKTVRVSARTTKAYNWKKGTKVSCNWKKKGKFYTGKIGQVKTKLFIRYDDGDKEWAEVGQCRSK